MQTPGTERGHPSTRRTWEGRVSLEEAEARGSRLITEIHGHLRLGISEVAAIIHSGKKSRGLVHTKVACELARGCHMRWEQSPTLSGL